MVEVPLIKVETINRVAALQDTIAVPAEPEVVAAEVIPAPSPSLNLDDQMANAMAAAN